MDNQDVNNRGDYIVSELGNDGTGNAVGKNIRQNSNHLEVNIPAVGDRSPSLKDVYDVLADDPLWGTPGLVSKVNAMDRRLMAVEGELAIVKTNLVDIAELITVRNREYSGKVHMTLPQLMFLLFVLILLIAVVAPWLQQHVFSSGVIDGRIGNSIFLRSYC